jgi:hypothetical protein
MRLHHILLVAIAFAGITIACGGSDSNDSDAAPASTADFTPAALAAAASANLTLADFPLGWSAAAKEPDEDPHFQPSEQCRLMSLPTDFPAAAAEARSQEFELTGDEDLYSTVGVYATDAAADLAQAALDAFYRDCLEEYARLFTQYADTQDPAIKWNATFESEPAPDAGEWAVAQKMMLNFTRDDGVTGSFELHGVTLRQGRLLASLFYTETGSIDASFAASLLGRLTDHMAEAEKSLPRG